MSRFSVLIALFVLSVSILGSTGCLVSDKTLINSEFRTEYPGYSDIKVLNRVGEGTSGSPRVLTIQVTIESYPDAIICEGELYYFHSDPSYRDMRWYSLEGVGHSLLIERARRMFWPYSDPVPCQLETVSLLLKRWIDKGWIGLDDITYAPVRQRVEYLLENPADVPASTPKNAGLFDTAEIRTYDLAPQLPDDEKVPVYVLRSNGTLELYLKDRTVQTFDVIKLSRCDCILESPIPKPGEGQK